MIIASQDRQAMVLSAWHVVKGPGACRVELPAIGQRWPAKVLGTDSQLDLAALVVETSSKLPAAPLAATDPPRGAPVVVCGYGGGKWHSWRATVLGLAVHNAPHRCDDLAVSGSAISGDSGGPIYNAQGEVVSIVWGGPLAGWNGPLLHTQGARTQALREFVQRTCILFPWASGPDTTRLQAELDALKARLLELERQQADDAQARAAIVKAIEQGDSELARSLLARVRDELAQARSAAEEAQSAARRAQDTASEVQNQTTAARKLLDSFADQLQRLRAEQPQADPLELLKKAGLGVIKDEAGQRMGDDRLERLLAAAETIRQAYEKSKASDPDASAGQRLRDVAAAAGESFLLRWVQSLGLPAGLVALALAIWKSRARRSQRPANGSR